MKSNWPPKKTMRRAKGTGSIVKIKGLYHARRRQNGIDQYGPARATQDEAERDRLAWVKTSKKAILKREVPTLGAFALDLLGDEGTGRYGRTLADATLGLVEVIRLSHLNSSLIAEKRLDRITKPDVQSWIDKLTSTKKIGRGDKRKTIVGPASASVKRRAHAFLSKVFAFAIEDGFTAINPCKGIALPQIHERENRVLEPEELGPLLKPVTRTDAAMLVAAHGLRRSEVCSLRWEDLDEKGGRIRVRQAKTRGNRISFRWVPVIPECMAALLAQTKHGETIFATESGQALDPHNLTRDFKARKAHMGIPEETRLQDLRGTFVTLLLDQGVDLRTVMELAGHKKAETTLKAYARSRSKTKTAAIANFGNAIRGDRVNGSGLDGVGGGANSNPDDPAIEPNSMVGGTGFEPVTPTVSSPDFPTVTIKFASSG
ncbi:MAG: tyrosine-type recombinase/integrase [Chthoniobacterales bacterium]